MFPSEMIILMAIAGAGNSGKHLLNRPMDVTGEYIGYLYNSLVKRGYLKGDRSVGYQLTSKGKGTLLEFLRGNSNRVEDTIRALDQLGIGVGKGVDRLKRELIEVK